MGTLTALLASLLLAVLLLAGYLLARALPFGLTRAERAAMGVGLGLLGGTWITWLAVLVFGYRWGIPTGALLFLAAAIGITARCVPPALDSLPRRDTFGFWVVRLFSLGVFAALFQTHYLSVGSGGWYSAGGTWGDLPLHTAFVTSTASQASFQFAHPLLAGAKLTYPFLADFLSGILFRTGFTLQTALILPSLLAAWVFLELALAFTYRLFRSLAAAWVALLLFLANGSIAGLLYAWADWRTSGSSLFAFLGNIPRDYTQIHSANLELINLTTSHLLPQRGMLFGLLAVLIAWLCWLVTWQEQRRTGVAPIFAGVVVGMLPFFHVHSFFMGVAFAVWFALTALQEGRPWRPWVLGLGLAVLLAAPQLVWQLTATGDVPTGQFIHAQTGWLTEHGSAPIWFWVRNGGLLVLLLLLGFVRLLWKAPLFDLNHRTDRFLRLWFLPLPLLFILLNLVSLQPNSFDNYKLFTYVFLGGAVLAAGFVTSWWRQGSWLTRLGLGLAIGVQVLPGILAVTYELEQQFLLFSAGDIAFAESVRAETAPEARILTATNHNNPVSSLAGRSVLLGYPGWFWTYGYDVTAIQADLDQAAAEPATAAEIFARYGISYVALREVGGYASSADPFDAAGYAAYYPLVTARGGWLLYRVDGQGTSDVR